MGKFRLHLAGTVTDLGVDLVNSPALHKIAYKLMQTYFGAGRKAIHLTFFSFLSNFDRCRCCGVDWFLRYNNIISLFWPAATWAMQVHGDRIFVQAAWTRSCLHQNLVAIIRSALHCTFHTLPVNYYLPCWMVIYCFLVISMALLPAKTK